MSDREQATRRNFLKLAATAAPAVAVAAATAGEAEAAALETHEGEGLRMTDNARKYYETARF